MRMLPHLLIAPVLMSLLATSNPLHAQRRIALDTTKRSDIPSIQRVPTGAFENLKTTVSPVEVFVSNYGILGLDIVNNRSGGIWPRGSSNPYIFGGGLWFAAQKNVGGERKKLSIMGYNPNSGASWFVPGVVGDDPSNSPMDASPSGISKYRLYRSTEYDKVTGAPLDPVDANGPYWPIWDTESFDSLGRNGYYGAYIDDTTQRHRSAYPKGPAIVSDEDIFCVYKDTEPARFEGQVEAGLPLGIQVEQTVYGWRNADFLIISYVVSNRSGEDLLDCYLAPMLDLDIGNAANDHARIAVRERFDDSLQLSAVWSDSEGTKRYGYFGIDILETPAVDDAGFLRRDKRVYSAEEQVGVQTMQSWVLEEDPSTPSERYDFIAAGDRDVDNGPGDRRVLFSTGPFSLHTGDSVRVVIALLFANGVQTVPTGQWNDMQNLIALDRIVQKLWDEGITGGTSSVSEPGRSTAHTGPRLHGSYPNPAGSSATIVYDLPRASAVELRLYDAIGREVARRDLGYQSQRANVARIDCSELPPGVYTYEIRSEHGSDQGVMTVVR